MDAGAIAAGLGAVVTGAGGVFLVVNEYRRRDRQTSREAIANYAQELYDHDQSYVELRRYIFEIRKRLADEGIDTPPPPRLSPPAIEPPVKK
jgi:hypothetical protein